MKTKVQIIFYSMYGHVYRLAEAVAQGAKEVTDVETGIFQVPELVPDDILEQSGAKKARAAFAHIPVARVEQLPDADAIIFGTPTRFGNMCSQMRNFLDQCGGHWVRGTLINKIGSVFASVGTQHGGHETTITSFHLTLFHLGNDRGGHALLRAETHEHGRDNRRDSLWRDDARRLGRPEPAG